MKLNKSSANTYDLTKLEWCVALLLTALALYLHIHFLQHAGGLWRDEAGGLHVATLPTIRDVWHNLQFDGFPILPPLIFRLWTSTAWGATDLGLRILGVGIGISIIGVLWLNARLLKYSFPLFSLALFSINPIVIRYGDSLRHYGLALLALLLTYGLIRKVTLTSQWHWVLAACIAAIVSVQCLYTNTFMVAALCLAGIAVGISERDWKKCARVAIVGLSAAVSLLPYLPIFVAGKEVNFVLSTPFTFQRFWKMLASATSASTHSSAWIWVILYLGTLIFLIIRLRQIPPTQEEMHSGQSGNEQRQQKNRSVFCLTAMLASLAGICTFLYIASLPTNPWYYLPFMAMVVVCLDEVWGTLRWPRVRFLQLAFAVVYSALIIIPVYKTLLIRQTNMDLIAAKVNEFATSDDLVVVIPVWNGISFSRYYQGSAPVMSLPPLSEFRVHRFDLLKAKMVEPQPLQPLLDEIGRTLESGHKVWLVGDLGFGGGPPTFPPAPHPQFGWDGPKYLWAWAYETGRYVQNHAQQIMIINTDIGQPIRDVESPSLQVVWGWQPRPTSPTP